MAAYAYKEVCHRADFTAMEEQFQEKYGREIDGDANYDGDYWTVAADLLDAKDTRIADLEARLATAEAEVVRLRDAAEDLRFHLGCESVAKDGYLTECEAASAVIADLRAKCEAAETKATISQITAETARAALAVVPMTEWQPIETAPKDGTAFIGLCDGLVYRVKWAQYYVKWPHEEGGPTFRGGWSAETSDQMFGCNPILWVPIPPERAGK